MRVHAAHNGPTGHEILVGEIADDRPAALLSAKHLALKELRKEIDILEASATLDKDGSRAASDTDTGTPSQS